MTTTFEELKKLFKLEDDDLVKLKAGLINKINITDKDTVKVNDRQLEHWLEGFRNGGVMTEEEVCKKYTISRETLMQMVKAKLISYFRLGNDDANKLLFLKSEISIEISQELVHSSRKDRLKLSVLAEKIVAIFVESKIVSEREHRIFCEYYFTDLLIEELAKKYKMSLSQLEGTINSIQNKMLKEFRAMITGTKKKPESEEMQALIKTNREQQKEEQIKALNLVAEAHEQMIELFKEKKTAASNPNNINLNIKLADLDLSARTLNCLKAAEIKTLEELIRLQKHELLSFRNFGKRSLTELEDLVLKYGLQFGTK